MGMPVFDAKKMMEVESRTEGWGVTDAEVSPRVYLPAWKRIFRLLEVMLEGLFSGKCDSCHYWRCCPVQREPKSQLPKNPELSSNNHLCPVLEWLEKIT